MENNKTEIVTLLGIFCGEYFLDVEKTQKYKYEGSKFSGLVWVRGAVSGNFGSRIPPPKLTPHLIIPLQNPHYRSLYVTNQVTFNSNKGY